MNIIHEFEFVGKFNITDITHEYDTLVWPKFQWYRQWRFWSALGVSVSAYTVV